ncbi:MAG: transketolase [Planctomycetota bacterium]|jgi:transketolase
MSFEAFVHAKAIQLDRACLEMCAEAGSGHPTSAMSIGHIVTVLMYNAMRWSPEQPRYPTSDRLVLSEGHAVPIVYAAAADLGVGIGKGADRTPLTHEQLAGLRESDSMLDGHPNPMEGFPFFDAATGSLGQGLSVAAGLGVAARLDEMDKRIYCVCGDGEVREGQIWEAVDFLVDHKLGNVLTIVNCNGLGQADQVSDQQSPEVLQKKFEAAGMRCMVIDGHDPAAIKEAIDTFAAESAGDVPMAVVARTVKGWGAPCIQGPGWHGKPPVGERLEKALEELAAARISLTSTLTADDSMAIYPPAEYAGDPEPGGGEIPTLNQAMESLDMGMVLRGGKLATRKAYGIALRVLGKVEPRIVCLDADVRNSTFADNFANDKELAERFVECKIAEQNMVSAAVGLSAANKIPYCSSFAKFLTRAYDQIEMGIYSGANIKYVGSHAGISLAADGPSQMALPDVSWFRSFTSMTDHHGGPGCYLLQPADAYAAYGLTMAMAEHVGTCYMRTFRPDVEFIYDESTVFNLGNFEVLTEGRDLLIVSAGYMVHECNKALQDLDNAGIDAGLVDLYSIPFNQEHLLDLINQAGGNVLVVEDNFGGGIGAAVAEACCASGDGFNVQQLHVRRIPKSARSEDEILKQCGLDHISIARKAAEMVGVLSV